MSKRETVPSVVTVTIDGKVCQGKQGQTILEIARAHDIYIPTMCYLTKVMPIASCRMCMVEVKGVEGMILSCQERAVEGAIIHTQNETLYRERQNIMKLYGVNHPLECGVCDKSGECDLQNKTLEFHVDQQPFAAKDQHRPVQDWGFVSYDPSLCIMCEKCVRVSNEITGNGALQIASGGYKSTIVNTKMDKSDMSLGESAAVCPVGALVATDFKYSSNAWELEKIPASCSHCSAACQLYYEVKNEKIYRVTNAYEFASLCGRGRFDFDFANSGVVKNQEAFGNAVKALSEADSVVFDSKITNEEALILQKLKEKLGFKLINHEARAYQKFTEAYSSISGKSLYGGTLEKIADARAIIVLGARIHDDNPQVGYHITMASKRHKARVIYMHPMEDGRMQERVTQFVKYEVGTEDGVTALLADTLLAGVALPAPIRGVLDDLDIGNLSAESNIGEEELADILSAVHGKTQRALIVGSDLYAHPRATQIAKLLALLERYAGFSVMLVPPSVNTLGVSLICTLDDTAEGKTVGYHAKADFVLSSSGEGDLDMPALNQQEGTFTSLDKRVVPTHVALPYGGFVLNDLAKALGVRQSHTVVYTAALPTEKGYHAAYFDMLPDYYDASGEAHRGYLLREQTCECRLEIEEVEELDGYDGVVVYRCDSQEVLSASIRPEEEADYIPLKGSQQFATAAKLKDGEVIEFTIDGITIKRVFRIDTSMKGTVALSPQFDMGLSAPLLSSYRFSRLKFQRVES